MSNSVSRLPEPTSPTAADVTAAGASSRQLAALLSKLSKSKKAVHQLRVIADGSKPVEIKVPTYAMEMLLGVLANMAKGKTTTVIQNEAELTTQQAAALLNVSRPFLVKLIEDNHIPFRKVGSHRRVRIADLMTYKKRIDEARLKSLDKLAKKSQELGLGY